MRSTCEYRSYQTHLEFDSDLNRFVQRHQAHPFTIATELLLGDRTSKRLPREGKKGKTADKT